ncbi:MAG TPA: hypothetical protein VEU96_24185 [Bryobacteraceae bacterium]|nr:hypothetical protein [Bryobacteraceae bacterium]
MVKKKLVEELVSDGVRLLCELDRRTFPVESMFWIHLQDQDYWRLVIGSPIVSDLGGVAAYRRLGELLQETELAGIMLEDISLLDPQSREFQSLFSLASASSRLAAGAAWLEFEDAVVYRWTGAEVSGRVTCDVSLDELNHIWEDERKILNRPALLIALEQRKVTLRFHPQHGPLPGIENIKFNFGSALRQARSDCQINWL